MSRYLRHEKIGVYYCNNDLKVADKESIEFLYNESLIIEKKVVRLCLHEDESSKLMSMLILVRDFFIYPAHRHSWKDESYTIVKGSMKFQELNQHGEILNSRVTSQGDTLLNTSKDFHRIVPLEKVLCFDF